MAEYKENLRRLALNDERFVGSVLGMGRDTVEVSQLDQKTHALVRLAASLAMDAALSSYQSTVEMALAAGASVDEIVGTLIAVAPTVGLTRAVSAAPELAPGAGLRRRRSVRDAQPGRRVSPTRPHRRGPAGRRPTALRRRPRARRSMDFMPLGRCRAATGTKR